MTVGALIGFPITSAAVSAANNGFLVDNRFGYAFQIASGTGPTSGIRKWDLWPNGDELRARSIGDIGIAKLNFVQCLTYNSQLLITTEDLSNSGRLLYFRRSDLTMVGSFGISSSNLAASTATRILQPSQLCPLVDARGLDHVMTASLTTQNEVNCVNVLRQLNTRLGLVDEAIALIGSKPDGSGTAGYILGTPRTNLGSVTDPCGVYVASTTGFIKLGIINPTDIDPAWVAGWDSFAGVSVDQTDNNIICGFVTLQSVTNPSYLAKINTTTGAIMWKVALPAGLAYVGADMLQHVIKTGTLYHLSGSTFQLSTINTVAGSISTVTLSQASVSGIVSRQVSEDVTGSLTWFGAWTEASSHPAYLGTYCLVQGHTSGTSMGWRYWPNGIPSPAPVYGAISTSRKRAWTFTLDGHQLYVLDLGLQGTFLYDQITAQWSKFITVGFEQWNLANGCEWGQRIVGGDLLTTDTWEMTPGALLDNDVTEIQHVVTGALVKRSRVVSTVAALRLAVSSGQLDDHTGAYVTLSFSDDQGKTFVTMPSINLTEGDYSAELAWDSLGSFAAPGRIFRITDVGGFVRIDGCDAGIDNFDEDEQGG